MSFHVPFGQYLPGSTIVHRTDARVKFLLAIAYTYAIFASHTWWALAALAVIMAMLYVVSKVPFRLALQGVRPLVYILVFTVVVNAFTLNVSGGFAPDGTPALALVGGFGLKPQGLLNGVYLALRIALLIMATSLVTFTTSAVELADGLTALMRPLKRFKVPVEDIATMFSIALRFIPTTAEEAERIMTAQRARGTVFDEGGLTKRMRAWVPVLVPLFVGLFRRADELAAAMDARCYTGDGRVRLKVALMRREDWTVLIISSVVCVAVGVLL